MQTGSGPGPDSRDAAQCRQIELTTGDRYTETEVVQAEKVKHVANVVYVVEHGKQGQDHKRRKSDG